jgi:hypothetical protein
LLEAVDVVIGVALNGFPATLAVISTDTRSALYALVGVKGSLVVPSNPQIFGFVDLN